MAHEAPRRSSPAAIVVAAAVALLVGAGGAYLLQQRKVADLQAQLVTATKAVTVADATTKGLRTQVADLEGKLKKVRHLANKTSRQLKEQKQATTDAQAQADRESADLPDGKYYGALRAVTTDTVQVDVKQFLTGKAAEKAAKRDGTEVTNDYYIVNESKQLRRLPVASSVQVKILRSSGSPQHKAIGYPEFVRMFNASSKSQNYVGDAGYWFWLDGGRIVKLEAQFTP